MKHKYLLSLTSVFLITMATICIIKDYMPRKAKIDSYNLFVVKRNQKFGIIDKNANQIVKNKYNFIDRLSEGYARVLINNKWGFINENLKLSIPMKYDFEYSFSEGYAGVENSGKWGFIDSKGNKVINLKFDWVSNFKNNIAAVKINGRFYFINKNGLNVFNKSFLHASEFLNGVAIVQSDSNSIEAINCTGKTLLRMPRGNILSIGKYIEGRFLISYLYGKNAIKYKLIDINNKSIAKDYDRLTNFNKEVAFYGMKYGKEIKWGIIKFNGDPQSTPKFRNIISNSNPLFGASIYIKKHEKFGFINNKGNFVIKPIYDSVGIFYGHYGAVANKYNGNLKWGMIDKSGSLIIKFNYEMVYPFHS